MYKQATLTLPEYPSLETGTQLDKATIEAALGTTAVRSINAQLQMNTEVMVIGSTALVATVNAIPTDITRTRLPETEADTDIYTSGIDILTPDAHSLAELREYRAAALSDLQTTGINMPEEVDDIIDRLIQMQHEVNLQDFCRTEFLFAHETPALIVQKDIQGETNYHCFDPLNVLSQTQAHNLQFTHTHNMPLLQTNTQSIKFAYLKTLACNHKFQAHTMAALWALESIPRSIKAQAELNLTPDFDDPRILPSQILANRIANGDNVVATTLHINDKTKNIDTYLWFKQRVLRNYGQACATDPATAFKMFVDYPLLGMLSQDALAELPDLGPVHIDTNDAPINTIELANTISKKTDKTLLKYRKLINYYYGGKYIDINNATGNTITKTYSRETHPTSINEPIALLIVALGWDTNNTEDMDKVNRLVQNWQQTVGTHTYDTFWKNEKRSFDLTMDSTSIVELVNDIKQNPDKYLQEVI